MGSIVEFKENFKLALKTQSLEKRSFDEASEKNKQKRLRRPLDGERVFVGTIQKRTKNS